MTTPLPTPGLTLDYVPCPGGARLIRVFGDNPCPVLPDALDGLALVQLGDYCFADHQRESLLPDPATLRRCVIAGAPVSENPISGNFLSEITLPDTLQSIGSCAFYNCRNLAQIRLGSQVEGLGSDVFLNTFSLVQLTVRARPDVPCGLFQILNSILTDVRVVFQPEDKILAAAWYPEYWVNVEECPAHILLQTYDGQGFPYRQCFRQQVPEWEPYDALLAQSRSSNPPAIITQLALDRLRFPFALSPQAADDYRAYLKENLSACVSVLLKKQDTQTMADLLGLDLMEPDDLQAAAQLARQADNAAFAALIADALAKKQPKPAAQKAERYAFNF